MPNTYAQQAQLTCTQCGRSMDVVVWQILDAAERPDLLARAVQGELYHFTCPHCGNEVQVDAPLLIYGGGWNRLAFSPAAETTREQDREQATGLLSRLRETVGADWQDTWLKDAIAVPRPVLGVYLLEGPEAMQQSWAEILQQQGEQSREAIPPELRSDIQEAQTEEQRYLHDNDVAALETAVLAWERVLRHPALPGASQGFQATVKNEIWLAMSGNGARIGMRRISIEPAPGRK